MEQKKRKKHGTKRKKKIRKVDPTPDKYNCDGCKRDITTKVRIKCRECDDFDLCIYCFYQGIEIENHKKDHKYSVINHFNTTPFTKDWTGLEEIRLLEGIEKIGIGNFEDIAKLHVKTKNKYECEFHYWNTYFHSKYPGVPDLLPMKEAKKVLRNPKKGIGIRRDIVHPYNPTPNPNAVFVEPTQEEFEEEESDEEEIDESYYSLENVPVSDLICTERYHPRGFGKTKGKSSKKKTIREGDPIPITRDTMKKDDDGYIISILKNKGQQKPHIISQRGLFDLLEKRENGKVVGSEVGFLPLRKSFEKAPYQEDAEIPIGEMEIKPTDPPHVLKMKEKMLLCYADVIKEREYRKKIIISKKLYDFSKYKLINRKRKREERDIVEKFQKYQRFESDREHNDLINGLLQQLHLAGEIVKFQEYRRKGILTKGQSEKFEREIIKRNPIKETSKIKSKRQKTQREASSFAEEYSELISKEEIRFVQSIGISLDQYMATKDFMIRENFRLGYLTKNSVKKNLHPDPDNVDPSFGLSLDQLVRVYDFCVFSGWINPEKIKSNGKPIPMTNHIPATLS